MNIVEILKTNGISKSRFAYDFNLSRPTLDEYISIFETSQKLPKDKYQIVFEQLFLNDLDRDSFNNMYKELKNLIKRDKIMHLERVDARSTDKIVDIVYFLKKSIDDNEKSELLPFAHYICSRYGESAIVDLWVKYFIYLNGLIDKVDFNEKEKRYIGYLYHINQAMLDDNMEIDELGNTYYSDYIKRVRRIKAKNSEKTKKIQAKLNDMVEKIAIEVLAESNETDNDDELMQKIINKISDNK